VRWRCRPATSTSSHKAARRSLKKICCAALRRSFIHGLEPSSVATTGLLAPISARSIAPLCAEKIIVARKAAPLRCRHPRNEPPVIPTNV
jgi:hypothetical protein